MKQPLVRATALVVLFALTSFAAGEGSEARPAGSNRSSVPQATGTDGALKDSLVTLEKLSWEAWKGRDGKFFQNFLSDDHVEVGFGGPTNKSVVVAGVASPACVVKSYAIDRFELTTFGANTALLTYHAEQDTACGGNAVPSPVWVSSLYIRRHNRWQNAAYQQTPTNR